MQQSGISSEISLQPTQSLGAQGGFITSFTPDQLAGSTPAGMKATSAPFATAAASFLAQDSGEQSQAALGAMKAAEAQPSAFVYGVERKIELDIDIPLPVNILHPEIANPNYFNCTSHSDAFATGECNNWCAVNPDDCLKGFVELASKTCTSRNPSMTECDCLRLVQQYIFGRGQIPLTIVPNPTLNSRLTQALLSGPIINSKCGPLTQAQQQNVTQYGTKAAQQAVQAQKTAEHFPWIATGTCKERSRTMQLLVMLLTLYLISNQ